MSAGSEVCATFVSFGALKPAACRNCGYKRSEHTAFESEDSATVVKIERIEKMHKNRHNASLVLVTEGMGDVYLSGFDAASNMAFLTKANIRGVVNAAGREIDEWDPTHLDAVMEQQKANIDILKIDWRDELQFALPWEDIAKAVCFIHQTRRQGEAVLVHCVAGRSRSASIILSYMVCTYEAHAGGEVLDIDAALVELKQKRRLAQPNDGFMAQLRAFQSAGKFLELRDTLSSLDAEAAHGENEGEVKAKELLA